MARFSVLLFLLSSLLVTLAAAQDATTSTSTATTTAFTGVPTIVTSGIGNYKYYGCWNETEGLPGTTGARTLTGSNKVMQDTMTVSSCTQFCAQGGFQFAGMEYSRECWCGNRVSGLATLLVDARCNLPCDGDKSQICGGSLALSIYQVPSGTAPSGDATDLSRWGIAGLVAIGLAVLVNLLS